jgi:hypothetical protein
MSIKILKNQGRAELIAAVPIPRNNDRFERAFVRLKQVVTSGNRYKKVFENSFLYEVRTLSGVFWRLLTDLGFVDFGDYFGRFLIQNWGDNMRRDIAPQFWIENSAQKNPKID